MEELDNLSKIQIGLASDETVRMWSKGEVKKKKHPSAHMSDWWKGHSGKLIIVRAKS